LLHCQNSTGCSRHPKTCFAAATRAEHAQWPSLDGHDNARLVCLGDVSTELIVQMPFQLIGGVAADSQSSEGEKRSGRIHHRHRQVERCRCIWRCCAGKLSRFAKFSGKRGKPDSFVSGFGWISHPRIETQRKIVALVERGGPARSFVVDSVSKKTVRKILFTNADRKSTLMTDEAGIYTATGFHYADHQTVNHGEKEYVRGDVTTNTVEGYFGIFKRGMRGVYQHCAEKNLHRYLAEFDFRYNTRKITDGERAVLAVRNASGKRLTYRQPR
jgi:hypothetical protein